MKAQPNHSTPIISEAPYAFGDIEIINAHEIGNVSLTVLAGSPYKTFDDFHKAVKANPGKLSIAFPRGGSNQLMALLLQEKLGWNVLLVPYESGTPARQALLGGHVTAMTNGAVTDADMKPRVRSLALSTPTKLAVWPDTPYVNDVLKAYGVEITPVGDVRFYGFKKGTRAQYPERFDKFVKAYQNAMKDPVCCRRESGARRDPSGVSTRVSASFPTCTSSCSNQDKFPTTLVPGLRSGEGSR
jgi:tripartite-type tricarboxylate transporter receptor subunit TctC